MKSSLLALLLAASAAFAQPSPLRSHFTNAWVDVYTDYARPVASTVPGAATPASAFSVSVNTTDTVAMVIGVKVTLKLSDGSTFVASRLLVAPSEYGKPLCVAFRIPPELTAVGIVRLDVTRLHQEPNDVLVSPVSGSTPML